MTVLIPLRSKPSDPAAERQRVQLRQGFHPGMFRTIVKVPLVRPRAASNRRGELGDRPKGLDEDLSAGATFVTTQADSGEIEVGVSLDVVDEIALSGIGHQISLEAH